MESNVTFLVDLMALHPCGVAVRLFETSRSHSKKVFCMLCGLSPGMGLLSLFLRLQSKAFECSLAYRLVGASSKKGFPYQSSSNDHHSRTRNLGSLFLALQFPELLADTFFPILYRRIMQFIVCWSNILPVKITVAKLRGACTINFRSSLLKSFCLSGRVPVSAGSHFLNNSTYFTGWNISLIFALLSIKTSTFCFWPFQAWRKK